MRSYFVLLIIPYLFSTTYTAAVPPTECGTLDEAQLRNGDILTQPNEHPWIGKIEDDQKLLQCVAVLIDASHALIPAHCKDNLRTEIKDIIFGDWNLSNKSAAITDEATQKIPVKKIILHPDFRLGLFENNLAIVELEEKVVYTDFVQPICLPSVENQKPSENLTVVGFGFKDPSRFIQSLENGRIKVPFETRPIVGCLEEVFGKNFRMGYTCGHTSRSPISGSALIEAVGNPKKFHLIGIVVSGFYQSYEARQIHVNILPRLDWILRNIGE